MALPIKPVLNIKGRTVAVLGTGIETVYPRKHRQLYHDIQQQGCILSEFWPDVGPFAGNFRNEIGLLAVF